MCFEIGIMKHTRIFLMDCDFSIFFNYDYITLYCVIYYMLTIVIILIVFIICHVYYIQISYVSNINNVVAQKTYTTLRNSYGQVLSRLFLPHSPYSSYHIPPTLLTTFPLLFLPHSPYSSYHIPPTLLTTFPLLFLPNSPYSSYHIPPTLILYCTPRLLMTLCTWILQLGIASSFLFRYNNNNNNNKHILL